MYVVVCLILFSYRLLYLTNIPPLCVCIYLSFLYSHSLRQSNRISISRLGVLTRILHRRLLPQGPQPEKQPEEMPGYQAVNCRLGSIPQRCCAALCKGMGNDEWVVRKWPGTLEEKGWNLPFSSFCFVFYVFFKEGEL